MARREPPVRPARGKAHDDDTLLIRSAESLGRVIGSLQRQVLGAAPDAVSPAPESKPARRRTRTTRAKKTPSAKRKTR